MAETVEAVGKRCICQIIILLVVCVPIVIHVAYVFVAAGLWVQLIAYTIIITSLLVPIWNTAWQLKREIEREIERQTADMAGKAGVLAGAIAGLGVLLGAGTVAAISASQPSASDKTRYRYH